MNIVTVPMTVNTILQNLYHSKVRVLIAIFYSTILFCLTYIIIYCRLRLHLNFKLLIQKMSMTFLQSMMETTLTWTYVLLWIFFLAIVLEKFTPPPRLPILIYFLLLHLMAPVLITDLVFLYTQV